MGAVQRPQPGLFERHRRRQRFRYNSGIRAPNYPGGTDSDSDGIPGGWEYYYGLGLGSALADPDGDGQNNLQEYLAGTVPTDPNSVLRLRAVSRTAANGVPTVTLTWTSVANKTYLVQSAGGPGGPWTTVATVPSAGDGTTTTALSVATHPATFFYRVIVSQSVPLRITPLLAPAGA